MPFDSCTGQLNDAELENQGLKAQLQDVNNSLANMTTAHEQTAARAAELKSQLEQERSQLASVSADLDACRKQVEELHTQLGSTQDTEAALLEREASLAQQLQILQVR